jgi:PAS domain S-box-containing protein
VLIGSTIISGLLLVRVWSLRKTPGAFGLMLALLSVTIWSSAYVFEIIRLDLGEKIFWAKVEYIGICFVALGAFIFVINYVGLGYWFTTPRLIALSAPAFFYLVLAWTSGQHNWLWKEIRLTGELPFGPLTIVHGPAFIYLIIYQYILITAITLLFLRIILREKGIYRSQSRIMLWGLAFPWAANFLYVTGLNPFPMIDLTPIALTITNVALSISFLRYRFMDLQPIAHSSVFNAMEDGVVVLDQKNRVVDINPVATLIFQDRGNTIGQEIQTLLPEWDKWQEENPRGEIHHELHLKLVGDELIFNLRTTSIYGEGGKRQGKVVLISDITASKEAEEKIMETNDMKTRLLASIGHDLRSPLGAIIGYAEMLKVGAFGDVNEDQEKASSEILDSANQLLTFINNFIMQAQIDTGKIVLRESGFRVEDIVGPLLSTLNFHANKKGIKLVQVVDSNLPEEILGDQFWIRQIVLNLVHNAVKFTETGSVTLCFQKKDPTQWVIQVKDTGIGIPPEAQKRIFEAFEQVNTHVEPDKHSGFGLGLSIVAQLTSIMKGQIELESEAGKGCTFTIILPMKSPNYSSKN